MPAGAAGWARLLAIAAAVSIVFSIAAKEILLGAAILALLVSRARWRMPAGWMLPLALFVAGTLVALALSPDPRAGWPQVKKFYAYLIVPVLFTALRGTADARLTLVLCVWAGVLSSLWSVGQFGRKWMDAATLGTDFYRYYVAQRTTGFMSHWQTLGGQLGILLPIALAFLFFARSPPARRKGMGVSAALLTLALALNLTRSIYIATALAVIYLVWAWRPRALVWMPAVALLALAIPPVRQRAVSLTRPQGQMDSNEHRLVTWRTGLNMIAANPWKGVGPDRVDDEFARYQPADVKQLPEGWYGHLHNIYLQYAADRGLPVLACFLWLLAAMLRSCWRVARTGGRGSRLGSGLESGIDSGQDSGMDSGRGRWLGEAGVAAWIGVTVSGFAEANLANSEVLHLFLVTMVCAAASLHQAASGPLESADQFIDAPE